MKNRATFQDIAKVAEQLESKGEKATIEAVRKILGYGSNTTIHKYLKERALINSSNFDLKTSSIYDPSIGTAGMLYKALEQINSQLEESRKDNYSMNFHSIKSLENKVDALENKINSQANEIQKLQLLIIKLINNSENSEI